MTPLPEIADGVRHTVEPPAPRVAPGGWRDIGPLAASFSALAGKAMGTNPPNLFRTLGRQRRLFFGWLHFAGRLMPGGTLPRRETELVILRVAHLRSCAYELEHHRHLAGRVGVDARTIERVIAGPDEPGWSHRERALLSAVDMLVERKDLDDETWADVRRHLDDPAVIELVLLVTHYDMLATTILTLRIQPDAPIEHDA
jgi:AhpD family alkylhydroperoxidase